MRNSFHILRARSRFSALTGIAVLALSPYLFGAARNDHFINFKVGQTKAYAEGQFSRKVHEVYFSFHARDGQHLFVKITPLTSNLTTAGVVIYPSGKQDGGPGGIVFDSELTETGKYRLRITQRQTQTNGSFRVLVELSP
jgi:hypothetical protein